MPFAEFQPSNAGAQVNDQILRNVDFGASLIERAQRSRVMAEDAEQRKQRFVMDQMTSDVVLQQQRLRLSQMEGEQKSNDAKNRAAVAESDSRYHHLTSAENMLTSAASEATKLAVDLQNEQDPDVVELKTADFLGKYSHLAGDKDFAVRFDEVARPITSVVSVKTVALRQKAMAAANSIRKNITPGDPDSMAAARRSPYLADALRDPAFRLEWAAATKAEADRANKIAEEAAKVKGQIEVDKAKTEGDIKVKQAEASAKGASRELSVPGFDGSAPTKEEAIKFRETVSTNLGIIDDVKRIAELSAQDGASTNLVTRAKITQMQDLIVGKLRLPLTGPGAFTDAEREFVRKTIGNPAKIFALSEAERAKLDLMISHLNADIDRSAATLGLSRSKTSGSPQTTAPATGNSGNQFRAYLDEATRRGLPVFDSKFTR